jgi:hypothetical protein
LRWTFLLNRDQTRPDQSKPLQSRPYQSRPDHCRPDQPSPDQTGPTSPDQSSPDQTSPDQIRPGQTSPDQSRPVQSSPDKTSPDQARPVKFRCFFAPLSPPTKLTFRESNMSGYHCGSHLNLFGFTQLNCAFYTKFSRRTKAGVSENFCSCKLRLGNLCLNYCISLLSWKYKDEKRLVVDTGTPKLLMLYLYLKYCNLVRYERVKTVGCCAEYRHVCHFDILL